MSKSSLAKRLIDINNYICSGGIVNVNDLSIKFSISQRQIQKDIKLFKEIYEIEDLGSQNYRLKDGFKVTNYNPDNQNIAFSFLKSLQRNAMPQMNRYIDDSLPELKEYKNMFILDTSYEEITHTDEFYKLIKAIKNQESCSFQYTKKDDSKKEVYVHPYKLANFSSFWYLLAYDVEQEKLKSYHMNSIDKVSLAGENYINDVKIEKEIDETFAKFNSVWFDGNPKSVKLSITGNAKLYIKRNFPSNATTLSEDDSILTLEYQYYNSSEVFSFVKQWLPDIKILNNSELQNGLKNILIQSIEGIK